MRTISLFVLALLTLGSQSWAQGESEADSTGLAGDHFSLEGAIELFKKANSPEEFEKLLNHEDSKVNNLDLNEDGEIDYIRVIDNLQGDVHAIVLQVPVNDKESQDIAVIEIEKQGEESAMLQIVGDEDLYGEQLIVEPFEEEKGKGNREKGPAMSPGKIRIVVNVWGWPSVRYVYRPGYTVWVSPWRWAVYPTWWRPWRPHPYRRFFGWTRPYHTHCHVVTTHRVVRAHAVYRPHRTHSKVVHTRTTTVVAKRGPKGTTVGKRTTTTTRGRNGHVKSRTTKTTVGRKGAKGNTRVKQRTTTRRRG
jgi:hypothetical protein